MGALEAGPTGIPSQEGPAPSALLLLWMPALLSSVAFKGSSFSSSLQNDSRNAVTSQGAVAHTGCPPHCTGVLAGASAVVQGSGGTLPLLFSFLFLIL